MNKREREWSESESKRWTNSKLCLESMKWLKEICRLVCICIFLTIDTGFHYEEMKCMYVERLVAARQKQCN